MNESILIRKGSLEDLSGMLSLYKAVSRESGGIARAEDEITEEVVKDKLDKALENGLILVAIEKQQVVGAVHASKPGIRVFEHVINDLTILIHPNHQGKGLGRSLFSEFLNIIKREQPEILRVELFCSSSNSRAISLYESLGFKQEGRFEKRVKTGTVLEDDIAMAWMNPEYRHSDREG